MARCSNCVCVRTALKTFHGPLHYQAEMEDIKKEKLVLNGEKPKKTWEVFTDRTITWQLIAIILMNIGQQLSGINAIYFYAGYVFTQAGISAEKIPYITLGTGACECITALTCEVYPWIPYVNMAAIFAFILSFGLGPGGVTNTLTAELFTQPSRPAAFTIGGSVSWISFFTIGMLFPFIVNGLSQYCFLVFFVECSLIATFIFFVVPETKNKSFLEIKQDFQRLNGRNGNASADENMIGTSM